MNKQEIEKLKGSINTNIELWALIILIYIISLMEINWILMTIQGIFLVLAIWLFLKHLKFEGKI